MLLQKGTDIHFGDEEALFSALFHNNTNVVKILLQDGANINESPDSVFIRASKNGKTKFQQTNSTL